MALTLLQEAQISNQLSGYCQDRVPVRVRNQVRLGFRIDGHAVELLESRPGFDDPRVWREHGIAKFRYVASRRVWRLYCQYRDLKWHEYQPRPTARSFAELLDEVDRDPTGIFWG
jgi:Txe/YoeB family toxin of Txe-Axe toxin-antitoxin module